MAAERRQAHAFAVAGGEPAAGSSRVRLFEPLPGEEWRLAAAVEPAPGAGDPGEVAAIAFEALCDEWTARDGEAVETDLLRAFAAVHRALRDWRRSGGADGGADGMAGLTAVAFAADEAIVAQSQPGRAIVAGARGVRLIPSWPAWDPALDPESGAALGGERAQRPSLHRLDLRGGDTLVLCDSGMGAAIWMREGAGRPFRGLLSALAPGSALELLVGVAAEASLDDAFSLVLPLLPEKEAARLMDLRQRGEAAPEPFERAPVLLRLRPRGREAAPRAWAPPSPAAVAVGLGGGRTSPLEQARMRVVEAVEARSPGLPWGLQPATAMVPGAWAVSRYSDPPRDYGGWRDWVPVQDGVANAARTLAIAALAGAGLAALVVGYTVRQDRIERSELAVVRAQQALGTAAADPAAAAASIADAEAALAEARRSGADPSVIRQLEGALEASRDRAWGVTRLDGMRRIGSLPAAVAEYPVRLLASAGKAYIAGYGLYEIDAGTGQLIEVLAPGRIIDGQALGPVIAAVADGSGVTVTDGSAIYRPAENGGWERIIPGPGGNPLLSRPSAAFNRMLYAISPEGSILRYRVEDGVLRSETWASVEQYPDLAGAAQLAVDERINVLLRDGTVETFFEKRLEGVSAPPVTPAMGAGAWLAANGAGGAIYLIDPETAMGGASGRLVRFVPGGAAAQYAAPSPGALGGEVRLAAAAVAQARQAAVVERDGMLYLLNGNDLWIARLPEPEP